VKNSRTVAMIEAIMAQTSTTPARSMAQKTALVLKDNAGVAMPASLVGTAGPAILEAWFPGQDDGNIVAQLLFGKDSGGADLSPSGKLPVTFPYAGKGFLDGITARQFPGVPGTDGVSQVIEYSEMLDIGYRWYDARQESGACATRPDGSNDCVAFPFGHGLSYNTKLTIGAPTVVSQTRQISMSDFRTTHTVTVSVTNGDTSRAGSEVVQLYVSLPPVSPNSRGAAQPPKRLVGFRKLDLAPGESKEVTFTIDSMASHHPLSIWSKDYKLWVMPPGTVRFHVGNSSSGKDLQTVSSTQ
jgi:beta-glucosidase